MVYIVRDLLSAPYVIWKFLTVCWSSWQSDAHHSQAGTDHAVNKFEHRTHLTIHNCCIYWQCCADLLQRKPQLRISREFIASCALHFKLPNLAMYNVQILLIVSDIDIARLLILGTSWPWYSYISGRCINRNQCASYFLGNAVMVSYVGKVAVWVTSANVRSLPQSRHNFSNMENVNAPGPASEAPSSIWTVLGPMYYYTNFSKKINVTAQPFLQISLPSIKTSNASKFGLQSAQLFSASFNYAFHQRSLPRFPCGCWTIFVPSRCLHYCKDCSWRSYVS